MTKNEFPFTDFNEILSNYQLPGIDMQQMMVAHQKNIQAITEANKIAAEGMQKILQHQTSLLHKTLSEVQENSTQMISQKSPQDQAEMIQKAIEKAMNNIKEMAEMATQSQTEAFQIVQKRYEDSLAELKEMIPAKTN